MIFPFTASALLGLVLLTLLVGLPIKIGAHLVHAQYTGIIRCGFTAFVALWCGLFATFFLGAFIGVTLAWLIGYLVCIRFMLGTTFPGAIVLTCIATLISVAGFWLLVWLGLLWSMPLMPAITTTYT